MKRVPRRRELSQHYRPGSGFAGKPPGHVQADIVSNLELMLHQQVMQPLMVHNAQVIPL